MLYLNQSPLARLRLHLDPRLYFSAIWQLCLWVGARIVHEKERRGKHGALKMSEFTSYSELASCISSWEKKFRASDKKLLLAFWIPSGGKVSNLSESLSNWNWKSICVCVLLCASDTNATFNVSCTWTKFPRRWIFPFTVDHKMNNASCRNHPVHSTGPHVNNVVHLKIC